jgi:hypothetical protein
MPVTYYLWLHGQQSFGKYNFTKEVRIKVVGHITGTIKKLEVIIGMIFDDKLALFYTDDKELTDY